MEGTGGSKIDWLSSDMFLNFKKNKCRNDKARSAWLTRITILDDADDDFMIIKVLTGKGGLTKLLLVLRSKEAWGKQRRC